MPCGCGRKTPEQKAAAAARKAEKKAARQAARIAAVAVKSGT